MEEKDIQLLVEKVQAGVKIKLEDFETASKDQIAILEKAIETQGIALRQLEAKGEQSKETIESLLTSKNDELQQAIKEGKKFELHIKGELIEKANVTTASVVNNTAAMRSGTIGELAFGSTNLEQAFQTETVSPTDMGVYRYIDQTSATRSAAFTAEGVALPESAIAWAEYSVPLEEIGDTIPVSKRSLNRISYVNAQVQKLLQNNMAIATNLALWSGSGVTPAIKGIYTYAPAFVTAGYTGETAKLATLDDLCLILASRIATGKQSKYMPNVVFLNPRDVNRIRLAKDTQGRKLYDYNGTIGGLKVVENSAITYNTCVLGDDRYATLLAESGVKIEIGEIDKQFVQSMVTLKATRSMALLVRTADVDGWLKVTDINAAITAITAA